MLTLKICLCQLGVTSHIIVSLQLKNEVKYKKINSGNVMPTKCSDSCGCFVFENIFEYKFFKSELKKVGRLASLGGVLLIII